jgi:hypothetical protein
LEEEKLNRLPFREVLEEHVACSGVDKPRDEK